ncbi:DUF2894 domain-containing protein, partial [Accumulibacter sp.]|uniref:DUF2894 domain-containing protein n=1 Tax=Accumulibacter sp. TaxID=2053492 RepID=UPI003FA59795
MHGVCRRPASLPKSCRTSGWGKPIHSVGQPRSLSHLNDSDVEIASLRRAGADHLDPVRFRFFEAMAKRARQQPSDVQRILDGKLM